MSQQPRSPAAIKDESRVWIADHEEVTRHQLQQHFEIGAPSARRLLDEFESEGLVSTAGKSGKRHVRSAEGRLAQPKDKPRRPWKAIAAEWIGKLTGGRRRGYDV